MDECKVCSSCSLGWSRREERHCRLVGGANRGGLVSGADCGTKTFEADSLDTRNNARLQPPSGLDSILTRLCFGGVLASPNTTHLICLRYPPAFFHRHLSRFGHAPDLFATLTLGEAIKESLTERARVRRRLRRGKILRK